MALAKILSTLWQQKKEYSQMKSFLLFMAQFGIWDIIGLFIALIPLFLLIKYFFPRKNIENLYIDIHRTC